MKISILNATFDHRLNLEQHAAGSVTKPIPARRFVRRALYQMSRQSEAQVSGKSYSNGRKEHEMCPAFASIANSIPNQ